MKYHWAEWGFEPTPATTAAPSPSESGVITTAPLRLLKTSFMEQYIYIIEGGTVFMFSMAEIIQRVVQLKALFSSL